MVVTLGKEYLMNIQMRKDFDQRQPVGGSLIFQSLTPVQWIYFVMYHVGIWGTINWAFWSTVMQQSLIKNHRR